MPETLRSVSDIMSDAAAPSADDVIVAKAAVANGSTEVKPPKATTKDFERAGTSGVVPNSFSINVSGWLGQGAVLEADRRKLSRPVIVYPVQEQRM